MFVILFIIIEFLLFLIITINSNIVIIIIYVLFGFIFLLPNLYPNIIIFYPDNCQKLRFGLSQ